MRAYAIFTCFTSFPYQAGMNKALAPIGFKVVTQGDPADGAWSVLENTKLMAFHDGIKLPAKGLATMGRARIMLTLFGAPPVRVQRPRNLDLAAQATAASTAAAAAIRGKMAGNDEERRLRAQGRF